MSVDVAAVPDVDATNDPSLVVVSDAAGRMQVLVELVRHNSWRAVAVEETVA